MSLKIKVVLMVTLAAFICASLVWLFANAGLTYKKVKVENITAQFCHDPSALALKPDVNKLNELTYVCSSRKGRLAIIVFHDDDMKPIVYLDHFCNSQSPGSVTTYQDGKFTCQSGLFLKGRYWWQ